MYDLELNRFLSADLFAQSPYFCQSFNRYSFLVNNTLSRADAFGNALATEVIKLGSKSQTTSPAAVANNATNGDAPSGNNSPAPKTDRNQWGQTPLISLLS